MKFKALAVAAALAMTATGAAQAAEKMGCCKGEECCCKEKDAAKATDHGHMDHGKDAHAAPASPKP